MGPTERRGLPPPPGCSRPEPQQEEQETPLARGAPARGYKPWGSPRCRGHRGCSQQVVGWGLRGYARGICCCPAVTCNPEDH